MSIEEMMNERVKLVTAEAEAKTERNRLEMDIIGWCRDSAPELLNVNWKRLSHITNTEPAAEINARILHGRVKAKSGVIND